MACNLGMHSIENHNANRPQTTTINFGALVTMEEEQRMELIDGMKQAFMQALTNDEQERRHLQRYSAEGAAEEGDIARGCIVRKEIELLFDMIKTKPECATMLVYYLLRTCEQPQYLFTFQRTLQAGYKHSEWKSAVSDFAALTTTTYHALKLFNNLLSSLALKLSTMGSTLMQ